MLKYKARNYKTLRGKHRILFDINHSKAPLDPLSRVMDVKTKINGIYLNLKGFILTS